MQVLGRVVGPVRPKGFGSTMPDYDKDALERWFEQAAEEEQRRKDASAKNRVRLGASLEQITHMEAAIWWPSRYVTGRTNFELETLNRWLWAKAGMGQFSVEGWVPITVLGNVHAVRRATAEKRVERAMLCIATGLIRDGVATGPAAPMLAPPNVSRGTPPSSPRSWRETHTPHELAEYQHLERAREEFPGDYNKQAARVAELARELEQESA